MINLKMLDNFTWQKPDNNLYAIQRNSFNIIGNSSLTEEQFRDKVLNGYPYMTGTFSGQQVDESSWIGQDIFVVDFDNFKFKTVKDAEKYFLNIGTDLIDAEHYKDEERPIYKKDGTPAKKVEKFWGVLPFTLEELRQKIFMYDDHWPFYKKEISNNPDNWPSQCKLYHYKCVPFFIYHSFSSCETENWRLRLLNVNRTPYCKLRAVYKVKETITDIRLAKVIGYMLYHLFKMYGADNKSYEITHMWQGTHKDIFFTNQTYAVINEVTNVCEHFSDDFLDVYGLYQYFKTLYPNALQNNPFNFIGATRQQPSNNINYVIYENTYYLFN